MSGSEPEGPYSGKLRITLQETLNLEFGDGFVKLEPFVTLEMGSQKFRTRTQKAGKNLKWNESFVFDLRNCAPREPLQIKVFHEDLLANGKIGRLDIALSDLFKSYDGKFFLVDFDNFKHIRGDIRLTYELTPDGTATTG